jgi:hypothetical protein
MFHEGRSIAFSTLEMGLSRGPGDAALSPRAESQRFQNPRQFQMAVSKRFNQGKSKKKIHCQEIVPSIRSARETLLHGEHSRCFRASMRICTTLLPGILDIAT